MRKSQMGLFDKKNGRFVKDPPVVSVIFGWRILNRWRMLNHEKNHQ